jgi:hypothetical protein
MGDNFKQDIKVSGGCGEERHEIAEQKRRRRKAQKGTAKENSEKVQKKFAPLQSHFLSICIYGLVIRNSDSRATMLKIGGNNDYRMRVFTLRAHHPLFLSRSPLDFDEGN